jgi:hypothetical protein
MDAHAEWSGSPEPSLAESNAEIESLFKVLLEMPALPVRAITERDADIQIG